jgi:hypothetical protein
MRFKFLHNRYYLWENGDIFDTVKDCQLFPFVHKSGYLHITLYNNGVQLSCKHHRLMAESFIPNPENKKCVNHKNGMKTDDRLENLEWATHSENTQHAYDNGLMKGFYTGKTGKKHPKSKPINLYDLNNKFLQKFESGNLCASFLKTSQSNFAMALKNKFKLLRKYYVTYA